MTLIPRPAGPVGLVHAGDVESAPFLDDVLQDLWPFLAVAAGRELVARASGIRVHLEVDGGGWPACGQYPALGWASIDVLTDGRAMCRRCFHRTVAAESWVTQYRDQVAQLLARAIRAARTADRVDDLRGIALLANLTAVQVRDDFARHPSERTVRLRQLIGTVRRELATRERLAQIRIQPDLVLM